MKYSLFFCFLSSKLERELEQLWQVFAHETELKALPGDTAQALNLHQLASQN